MNQHRNLSLFVLLSALLQLVSCSSNLPKVTIASSTVSSVTESVVNDGLTNATVEPSSTPTVTLIPSSPTVTPVPVSLILEDYPLHVGSTWTYQVTVEYQDFDPASETVFVSTWEGKVTEKILSREQLDDGSIKYITVMENYPDVLQDSVEPVDRDGEYIISDGGVDNQFYRIIQWPVEIGTWWYFSETIGYIWEIFASEDVTTQAGAFEDCFILGLATRPDTTVRWFCPGIGFVREDYRHNGTVHNEFWELIEYSLPE
jgi:hypothetical protein